MPPDLSTHTHKHKHTRAHTHPPAPTALGKTNLVWVCVCVCVCVCGAFFCVCFVHDVYRCYFKSLCSVLIYIVYSSSDRPFHISHTLRAAEDKVCMCVRVLNKMGCVCVCVWQREENVFLKCMYACVCKCNSVCVCKPDTSSAFKSALATSPEKTIQLRNIGNVSVPLSRRSIAWMCLIKQCPEFSSKHQSGLLMGLGCPVLGLSYHTDTQGQGIRKWNKDTHSNSVSHRTNVCRYSCLYFCQREVPWNWNCFFCCCLFFVFVN